MPYPSANTLPAPALPISFEETPRVVGPEFGNGYSQRAADGLNSLDATFDALWEPLTLAEKNEVVSFLRDRNGTFPFTYTLDGETRTFIATSWRSEKLSGTHYRVSAVWKRVFD